MKGKIMLVFTKLISSSPYATVDLVGLAGFRGLAIKAGGGAFPFRSYHWDQSVLGMGKLSDNSRERSE